MALFEKAREVELARPSSRRVKESSASLLFRLDDAFVSFVSSHHNKHSSRPT